MVLIGIIPRQKRFDRECEAKAFRNPRLDCRVTTPARAPEFNRFLRDLAQANPGVHYLDPYPALCDTDTCVSHDGPTPLYYDHGHLSLDGSERVGRYWADRLPPEMVSIFSGSLNR